MGRRKRPFYRIVAIDSRSRRDGPEIERLGWFDPLQTDIAVDLKEDRIIHWIQQGAQPTETANNIISTTGLLYKMHLMREGKSEEEIASALIEWQLKHKEIIARKEKKKKAKKKELADKTQAVESEEAASAEASEEEATVVEEDSEEAVTEEVASAEASKEADKKEKTDDVSRENSS